MLAPCRYPPPFSSLGQAFFGLASGGLLGGVLLCLWCMVSGLGLAAGVGCVVSDRVGSFRLLFLLLSGDVN